MHEVFDHQNFYVKLDSDLRQARYLVVIQSPFITAKRVSSLKSILANCLFRKVRVCVFTQKIDHRYLSKEEYLERLETFKKVSKSLISLGVHLNAVPKIHEKLVVIDEHIFWEGSLNPLSYRDTSERMIRWQSRQKVLSVMTKHNLNKCLVCLSNSLPGDIHKMFGEIIFRRRRMLHLSQQEFAKITGIAQSRLSDIEKGKLSCRLETIARIFSALQMNCRALPENMIPAIDQELNLSLEVAKIFDSDSIEETI